MHEGQYVCVASWSFVRTGSHAPAVPLPGSQTLRQVQHCFGIATGHRLP